METIKLPYTKDNNNQIGNDSQSMTTLFHDAKLNDLPFLRNKFQHC